MPDIFSSILSSSTTLEVWKFVILLLAGLVLGAAYAASACPGLRLRSESMATALLFLPAAVCVTIMAVNGNIGVGVAVAGAFSLVRFRSAAGTARDISVIFMAMCTGLLLGTGYIAYAALFTALMCAGLVITACLSARRIAGSGERVLKITVPEDLDYTDLFDGAFSDFTEKHELRAAKTADMGSLYKLTYLVTLRPGAKERDFIDALRTLNGNLEISLARETVRDDRL